ncbi:hypothetical protein JTB14_005087 [Gonioctena quinquepunctata]|nr:hypothetical protein JTB14_005087 [Gonioctena quinquepunctata]
MWNPPRANQQQKNETGELEWKAAPTGFFLFVASGRPPAMALIGTFGISPFDPGIELQNRLPWLSINEPNDAQSTATEPSATQSSS